MMFGLALNVGLVGREKFRITFCIWTKNSHDSHYGFYYPFQVFGNESNSPKIKIIWQFHVAVKSHSQLLGLVVLFELNVSAIQIQFPRRLRALYLKRAVSHLDKKGRCLGQEVVGELHSRR